MNSFGVSLLLFDRFLENFPVWKHGNVPQNRPFFITGMARLLTFGGFQI